MKNITVSQKNLEMVEEELDYALSDCYDAPMHLVVEIVLNVLDTAEREGRLNAKERLAACDYLSKVHGYNF